MKYNIFEYKFMADISKGQFKNEMLQGFISKKMKFFIKKEQNKNLFKTIIN